MFDLTVSSRCGNVRQIQMYLSRKKAPQISRNMLFAYLNLEILADSVTLHGVVLFISISRLLEQSGIEQPSIEPYRVVLLLLLRQFNVAGYPALKALLLTFAKRCSTCCVGQLPMTYLISSSDRATIWFDFTALSVVMRVVVFLSTTTLGMISFL